MDQGQVGSVGTRPRATVDPQLADALHHGQRIHASRRRWADPDVRDRFTLRTGALAFAIVATILAIGADWGSVRLGVLALTIIGLAVASTVELEVGSAAAVPTEPLVVAMLLMLPAGVVPVATFAAILASTGYLALRGVRRESPTVSACSSAYILGPALVVGLVGLGPEGPRWWAVIALAFGAQLLSDLFISWWRNCVGLGLPFGELVEMLRWSAAIDLLLLPGAVAAVMAVDAAPVAVVLVMAPTALVALLARDRTRQVDRLLTLGTAYRDATGEARRDALTGLGNRLAWDEAIAAETAAGREGIGIMMLDVDHLKWVNDRFGHATGDRLLLMVAEVIHSVSVSDTVACRLGGDEFGFMVVQASTSELAQLAGVITRALSRKPDVGDLPVSVSIGFATAAPGRVHEAVRDADLAMYRNKQLRGDGRRVSLLRESKPFEPAV